jgi:hypothetical protein
VIPAAARPISRNAQTSFRAREVDDEPCDQGRSSVKIRGLTRAEPLNWQLDQPAAATSGYGAKQASYRVRRAAAQEPLPPLVPAEEPEYEPSPSDQPGEPRRMQEIEPTPAQQPPRQPFRSVINRQPAKKQNGEERFQVKCPSKEEIVKPISELSLDIAAQGKLPKECPLYADAFPMRCWCDSLYMWKASCLCHKPLYFEQRAVERYGHSWGPFLQPVVSGAHFFASIPILPYKMGVEGPRECMYPLGYYRPGGCAPQLIYPVPISLRGAIYQAAAVTGVVYLLP